MGAFSSRRVQSAGLGEAGDVSVAIRVRIIDPDFRGVSRAERHEAIWRVLEDLPDLSAHEVYACGNPLMIDAARSSFTAAGLPAGRFLADAFVVNN